MTHSHTSVHNAGRIRTFLILALAVVLCTFTATTAVAADGKGGAEVPPANSGQADPAKGAAAPDVDPDAAEAMAKAKGITIAEAKKRLAREKALGEKGSKIEKSLHGHTGGSYLDKSGELVVTTLDAASNAVVKQNGARPQLVDDSSAELDSIMDKLNQQSKSNGAGKVQGWYVDIPTNTVVVTVSEGTDDPTTSAMTKLAKSFGDSVRIERKPADEAPQLTAALSGGFEYRNSWNGGGCSIGFNTRDSYNRNVVLTAGHCVTTSGWLSRSGYRIGTTRTANFPTDDFGTFWNQYPSYWQPSPSVYKYDGTYIRVAGQWNTPTVGSTVCKSGFTTRYTCGTIRATNQTVNYGSQTIYGLVRHSACVEPGDSGGANISAGRYALGVTSGANLVDGRWCQGRYGRTNVSWYQPVGEALSRNGLRLVL